MLLACRKGRKGKQRLIFKDVDWMTSVKSKIRRALYRVEYLNYMNSVNSKS